MANIELWTGLPGSGRKQAAIEKAVAESANGGHTWWIVDTSRRAEDVESTLLNRSEAAAIGIETVLAGRLPEKVLAGAGHSVHVLPPDIRELIFRAILTGSEFRREHDIHAGQGWVNRASQIYERLHVGEHGDDDGGELHKRIHSRFPWMLTLFKRYEEKLQQRGIVDEAHMPRIGIEASSEKQFNGPDLVVIDRLPQFPPQLELLLRNVAVLATSAIILLDDIPGAPALRESERQVATWRKVQGITEHRFDVDPTIEDFARNLFAPGVSLAENIPLQRTPKLVYYADLHHEIDTTAREAARLVHVEGVQQRDIAIAVADPSVYIPILREILPRHGLRLDTVDSRPLASRPLAAIVHDLLKLRSQGFSRERMTSLLLNPFVKYGDLLHDRKVVLQLDSAARSAGIHGGYGSFKDLWEKPLTNEFARLRRELERAHRTSEEETPDSTAFDQRIQKLEKALAEVKRLYGLIGTLPDPCPPDGLREWLGKTLNELGVAERLHSSRTRTYASIDERLTQGRIEVLLEHIEQTLRVEGINRVPLNRMVDLFTQAIRRMNVVDPARVRDGLAVLTPGDLRGRRFHKVFLAGLTDETWPALDNVDPSSPERPREASTALNECRALMLECMLSAWSVTFSSPAPLKGETKVAPSSLLDELRIANLGEITSPPPTQEPECFTSTIDLLPALGRNLSAENQDLRETALKRIAAAKAIPGQSINAGDILHSVRVEMQRQDPRSLGRYQGLLTGSAIGELLSGHFADRPLSASRLDIYAQCPIRFFHSYVLQAEELEDVEDQVPAMTLGSLAHVILAETVRQLRTRRSGPIDLADNLNEVEAIMAEIAHDMLAGLRHDTVYWDIVEEELIGGLAGDDRPDGRLKGLLNKEDSGRSPKLKGERITHIEAGFGMPHDDSGGDQLLADPLILVDNGLEVQIRGRIDRIGEHPDKGYRVWDYKTGKNVPNEKRVRNGLSFQLPVYLWAFEEYLRRNGADPESIESAGYLKLDPGKTGGGGKIEYSDFKEYSDDLKQNVLDIRRSLAAGRYHHPLSQDKLLCDNSKYNMCPFKNICRRDHLIFAQRERMMPGENLSNAYLVGFQDMLRERRDSGS